MDGRRGDSELFLYREGARVRVRLDLRRIPDRPGRTGRWAGTFAVESFTVLIPGRGVLVLPDGTEAEVIVEGYDVVTGRGDLIGIDTAPF